MHKSIIIGSQETSSSSLVVFLLLGIVLVVETSLDFVEDDLVGSLEGVFELLLDLVESSGSDSAELSVLLDGALDTGGGLDLSEGSGSGVKSLHHGSVLKRVSLGLVVGTDGGADLTELGLNLVGVDNSSEVSAGHEVSLESVAGLLLSGVSAVSEDGVEGSEGLGGEDNESSEVTTGGELEEVESVDGASVDTGEVAGNSLDGVVVSVDDKGSLTEDEAGASHLTVSSSVGLGGSDSVEVVTNTVSVEDGEEVGGLVLSIGVPLDNKGKLGDVVASVTSGLDEGSDGGSGKSGGNGVSLLGDVDLSVPLSPGAEGGEHASLSAHVTEGGLSRSVGTGTGDSRNTGDGASSSPGLGRVLMSLLPEDSVSLSSVLGHVGVDKLNDVVSDGGREDLGHRD